MEVAGSACLVCESVPWPQESGPWCCCCWSVLSYKGPYSLFCSFPDIHFSHHHHPWRWVHLYHLIPTKPCHVSQLCVCWPHARLQDTLTVHGLLISKSLSLWLLLPCFQPATLSSVCPLHCLPANRAPFCHPVSHPATSWPLPPVRKGEKILAEQQVIDYEFHFSSYLWLFKQLEDRLCSLYVCIQIRHTISCSTYPWEFVSKPPFGNS